MSTTLAGSIGTVKTEFSTTWTYLCPTTLGRPQSITTVYTGNDIPKAITRLSVSPFTTNCGGPHVLPLPEDSEFESSIPEMIVIIF